MGVVVFCFDLERDNQAAFNLAATFSLKMGNELILVNAFDVDRLPRETDLDYAGRIRKRWSQAFLTSVQLEDRFLAGNPRILRGERLNCRYRFGPGKLLDLLKVLDFTEEVDLVVVELSTGFHNPFQFGNAVMDRLLRETQVPLLVLPQDYRFQPIEKWVFPIRDRQMVRQNLELIEKGFDYARALEAQVQVHTTFDDGFSSWFGLKRLLNGKGFRKFPDLEVNSVREESYTTRLKALLKEETPQAALVLWEGVPTLVELFGGDLSGQRGLLAPYPVFILHHPDNIASSGRPTGTYG